MDMENLAVIVCNISARLGPVLYASLAVGYYMYNRYRGSEHYGEVGWQALWLMISLMLVFLSGSVHDYLIMRQTDTSLFYELLLKINKVIPRILWFLVLAAVGSIRLKKADVVLITAYGILMLVTPRMSNMASLAWGIPFLWGAFKTAERHKVWYGKLSGLLLLGFLMHMANATANISGVSALGVVIRGGITVGYYPVLFGADLTARIMVWRDEGVRAAPGTEVQAREPDVTVRAETEAAQAIEGLADSYGLTPRETEIVQYIYDGMTNREIAERIYTAEGTVKAHNYNIYSKLGISKRTQLILAINEAREKMTG